MAEIRLTKILFLICVASPFAFSRSALDRNKERVKDQCGYSSCPATKEGFINVHIIPHTHDDVGWLKTVDQYYFGSKISIQRAGVQYILDSVIQELKKDPSRRFIYVETAFFWKWWLRQSAEIQKDVRQLVASGRLEFISGGWSMHDEATSHYQSILDQFTWGFRKLNDTFGRCGVPRVGWQIDPFGHSRETASMMARLGFDGLFLGRIDYRDKKERKLNKTMEMVWQASPNNLGKEAELFTGVLYNTYSAPPGFCFDALCHDEPIIDDKNSPEYNADRQAAMFLEEMSKYSVAYKGSNIAVTFGEDFNYQAAAMYFNNLDVLIKAVNSRQASHNSDVNLLYSTPSCYLKALNNEGLHFPLKDDDFFSYASDPHAYWAGYFTSRPTLKRFERLGNNLLQICKQTASLSNLEPEATAGLDTLREAMGVLQHHDGVSGTEKQHVANDYARQLSEGLDSCANITEAALNKLMRRAPSSPPVPLANCMLLNISQCDVIENHNTFVVTLYNPLSRPISHYMRLPVAGNGLALTVYDYRGEIVPTQAVPVPGPVMRVPGRFSQASVEVVFKASDIPPLGYRSYYVTGSNSLLLPTILSQPNHGKDITLGKGSVKLTIDGVTGQPTKLHGPGQSEYTSFQQNFYYFLSADGDNSEAELRSSGAYVLRPNSSYAMVNPNPSIKYYKGPVVDEVHQEFSDWVSQVIRYYHNEMYLQFNWMVGPIPISDNTGKEVVTRYHLYGMNTNGTFYTDSNGREMLKRERNRRPSYNFSLEEPVAGNYYPVTTRISIKDENLRLSVLTDRAEGGTSLHDGEVEMMLHRRILHDDSFGVDEALNETAFGYGLVARGTHLLTIGPSALERKLAQTQIMSIQAFFTPTSLGLSEWQALYWMEWSGLQAALPQRVQILTLEPWKDSTTFLLRLENILEVDDSPSDTKPVTLNLQKIFKPFSILWVRESSLGANQWLDEVSRLVWKKEDNIVFSETAEQITPQPVPLVSLPPMAIKTFIIRVNFS